jgi:hypothetical protein
MYTNMIKYVYHRIYIYNMQHTSSYINQPTYGHFQLQNPPVPSQGFGLLPVILPGVSFPGEVGVILGVLHLEVGSVEE